MTDSPNYIQLRPMEEADYPRIAELMNMFASTPITPEELLHRHQASSPETIRQRMVALDKQEYIVGFAQAVHAPWMPSGKFRVAVNVDRVRHRQGIGSHLYTIAHQFTRFYNASLLESEVREDQPEAVQFAQHRGFTIHRHLFESTLDLARFDEARFQGVIEQVEASGIRFFSLAELGSTFETHKKLHEHILNYAGDIPGLEDEPLPPFEQMRKTLYQAQDFHADAQVIAVDGERWVGSALLTHHPANNSMYNAGSGVERAYRGRHLALALKLLSIRCARRHGVALIRTNNDSENTAMLALNRKLGYIPQPGIYTMQCTLP